MIRQWRAFFALVFLTVFITSCSLAPLTPRVDAASVGKGKVLIQNNFLPTTSVSVIYGVNEQFDIGLDLEQAILGTAWGRYSFINNPEGFSLAANGGVFIYTDVQKANGFYTGLIASNQWSPRFRTTASLRYADLDYEFSPEDDGGYFDFDEGFGFDNPDDGSANIHADLTFSILIKSHIELALGAICQYLPRNEDPERSSEICAPTIGFTYYRL